MGVNAQRACGLHVHLCTRGCNSGRPRPRPSMQLVAERAISGMGLGGRGAMGGYRVAVRRRGSLVGRRNDAFLSPTPLTRPALQFAY